MNYITKLCADDLRTFISNNYSIKLKATHAHELVAAFFGYKTNAALLADTNTPISNLPQAHVVILAPSESIDERRKRLHDLPLELPDTQVLGEIIFTTLSNKGLLSKPWPTYEHFAKFLADECLREKKMDKIYRNPVGEGVSVKDGDDHKQLIVSRFYQQLITNSATFMVNEFQITTFIKLPLVAGRIGYNRPEFSMKIENLGTR